MSNLSSRTGVLAEEGIKAPNRTIYLHNNTLYDLLSIAWIATSCSATENKMPDLQILASRTTSVVKE